ncbi:MAG: hypothetical protein NXI31_03030 [bacterium]|nr:hypothetical protein [bacterium]
MPDLILLHAERAWWLLTLPLVLWLVIPPRPRRVEATAHLPQWEAALQGLRRRRPRAFSLQLLLLLLAAACAVLALLGLGVAGQVGPQRLVVLLDGSQSMAAHSAFERARERVVTTLADLPAEVDVRVLRCGGPMLRRHGESARRLHDLGAPAGSRHVDLAALAGEVAGDPTADVTAHDGVVVWTLTDGQGVGTLPTVGALTTFGAAASNAAVLGVTVTDRWPLPGLELAIDVIGHGAGAELAVEVAARGAVVAPWSVTRRIPVGEVVRFECELERTVPGGELLVEVALAQDALPTDDRWRLQLPPLPAPRIAVLAAAESGPFVVAAAAALATEVRGQVVAPAVEEPVGLLLVDGGEVAIEPGTVRALCFGARFGGPGAGGAAEPAVARAAAGVEWDRQQPFLAGLDLSELRVERWNAETLPTGPGVEPFLFAGEEPLAVVHRGQGTRGAEDGSASVHFAFRLADSNLPLLAAFPQLLRRLFVRSYGAAARIRVDSTPPPAGEQDLWLRATAPDRPLPEFGTPDRPLGAWLLGGGAVALLVRILCRRRDRAVVGQA